MYMTLPVHTYIHTCTYMYVCTTDTCIPVLYIHGRDMYTCSTPVYRYVPVHIHVLQYRVPVVLKTGTVLKIQTISISISVHVPRVLRTYYYYKQYIYVVCGTRTRAHVATHVYRQFTRVLVHTFIYIPVYQLRVRDTDTWTYVWYRCTFFNIQGTRVQCTCTCMYRYMYNTKTNLFFYMRYNLLLL